ncbi:hypothetical protein DV736_g1280, partial [Chaetothyriales sp. CBS 134916]
MPYRGKPSQGCQACRNRRIRCDQRKDGCRNCEKGNRVCPGYRDQLDLMFLDQTKQVADKARRSNQALLRTTCDVSPERKPAAGAQPLPKNAAMAADRLRELSPDLEQRATRYFFETFTLDRNVDEMCSIYTTAHLSSTPGHHALIHAIQALGLAGLSRSSPDQHLMRLADSSYISSIRSMNAALVDPVEAKKDATLLGVLILTVFEAFANSENRDLVAWGSHIKGMAALLEMRGKEQLHTKQGRSLFIQAAVPICTNCIQLSIPLPPIMMTLTEEALRIAGPNDSRLALVEHKLRFVSFYTAVRRKEITDLVSIVRQAKALDDEIATLLATLKRPWTYTTVAWASRILLNQMIRSVLLLGFAHRPPIFSSQADTDLFHKATTNLVKVQDDIIATVPQYLGHLPNNGGTAARKDQGGALLPWMLFLIAIMDVATPQLKNWVLHRLDEIGRVNITFHPSTVTPAERVSLRRQRGLTIWLTGLSASGKSTIAVALEQALLRKPYSLSAYRLDGDNIRFGLNKDLGFSPKDREENIRRIAEVAKLFADSSTIAITSFISPYRADRDLARQLHENDSAGGEHGFPFVEVWIDVPVEVAEKRDPKGLYKKAREGKIPEFTGISAPYEEPLKPEIHIKSHETSVEDAVTIIVKYLEGQGYLTPPPTVKDN